MTICERCAKPMHIESPWVDVGDGNEQIELEFCTDCEIVNVNFRGYKVREG